MQRHQNLRLQFLTALFIGVLLLATSPECWAQVQTGTGGTGGSRGTGGAGFAGGAGQGGFGGLNIGGNTGSFSTSIAGSTLGGTSNVVGVTVTNPFQTFYANPYSYTSTGQNSASSFRQAQQASFGTPLFSGTGNTGTGIGTTGTTGTTGGATTNFGTGLSSVGRTAGTTGGVGRTGVGGTTGGTLTATRPGGITTGGNIPGGIGGGVGIGGIGGGTGVGVTQGTNTAGVGTRSGLGFSTVGYPRAPYYVTQPGYTLRPRIRSSSQLLDKAQRVISRSSSIPATGVRVATDGKTIVLRGSVRDPRQKRLAESLIRLTPGIRSVRNELKVSPK